MAVRREALFRALPEARPAEPPARVLPEPDPAAVHRRRAAGAGRRGRHRRRDGAELPARARRRRGGRPASHQRPAPGERGLDGRPRRHLHRRRVCGSGATRSCTRTPTCRATRVIGAGLHDRPVLRRRGLSRRRRIGRVVLGRRGARRIGRDVEVGPFVRMRPGVEMGDRSRAGAFVDMKAARVGRGSKVPHLSYVGDAEIGEDVNVGAATVTVNYDGYDEASDRDRRRRPDRVGYDAGGAGHRRSRRRHGGRIGDHGGRAGGRARGRARRDHGSSRATASAGRPAQARRGAERWRSSRRSG